MPVHRISPEKPSAHPELIEVIEKELRAADAGTILPLDGDAPEIIEEEVARSPHIQVTVLWNRWKDVGLEVRGGIILDAYKIARGESEVRNISRALGLTHEEAARLGIAV